MYDLRCSQARLLRFSGPANVMADTAFPWPKPKPKHPKLEGNTLERTKHPGGNDRTCCGTTRH